METVHLFISTGRFRSFEEAKGYIYETYTEDGDGIPSPFMREVGLDEYEPGCIDVVCAVQPEPLAELLKEVSFGDQWVAQVDANLEADTAICVYEPNVVEHPAGCSLTYVGAFEYQVVHPEWFEQLLRETRAKSSPTARGDEPTPAE